MRDENHRSNSSLWSDISAPPPNFPHCHCTIYRATFLVHLYTHNHNISVMHILVVDLGLNVIVIFYFAGGNGLVDTQQKNDDLPPSSKPYIRPPIPTHLYQCNNISNMILLSTCTLVQ